MGVSTDAILFFGVVIDDDSETHELIVSDMHSGPDGEPVEGTLAWLNWMGEESEGCKVRTHCSDEYPMYYVAVAESEIRAWRGRPVDLTSTPICPSEDAISDIDRESEWSESIARFKGRYALIADSPRWYLVSYWG